MTLRRRLLAAFAYVLVLTLVALEVPLALSISRRVDAEVKSEASSGAQLVASSAAGSLGDERELARLATAAGEDLGGRVILVDERGLLIADSAGRGLERTDYSGRPEIDTALAGETSQGTRHSDSLDQDLLYTAVPILRAGRSEGAVRVTQSVAAVQSEMRADVLALVAIGAGVLVLGLALAWVLAGSIARPLHGLANAARGVAGGDLGRRAPVTGSQEQREVAMAFNEMTTRVAQVLSAQRDFVANASHQLRTPLTGLRLRLEAAALKSEDPRVRRDLEAAERETERLARLLNGLLALAREDSSPAGSAPVPLDEHVAAAVERWRGPAAARGGTLVVLSEEPAAAFVAQDDLAVILDNLIENALDYGGERPAVTIGWTRTADAVRLTVADDGPGVPPGEEERVFERFRRAAPQDVPGTGLGLPIVRALAERWGGTATIRNGRAGGACAEVRFRSAAGLPDLDPQLDDALPAGG